MAASNRAFPTDGAGVLAYLNTYTLYLLNEVHVMFKLQPQEVKSYLHEILTSLKLKRYLTNIYEIRFLMKNSLKYTLQCQNGFFQETCRATMVP